jgi:TatD DNase family protein
VLTDTHCHLDLDKFDPDREAVLERAVRVGIDRILIPGLNLASSRAVLKLVESHPILFAAIGVHPTEAASWSDQTSAELKIFLQLSGPSGASGTSETREPSKIVAIGEIGLDYYWDSASHELQKKVLLQQLKLAGEASLPVVLHMREARGATETNCAADLLQILELWSSDLRLRKSPLMDRLGVLHSFSGSLETARAAIDLGFYIGVTGPVTFVNAARRQEIVAALPLDRILIETDAPFLAPYPQRGKRNEPALVRLIADKIALLHSCSFERIAAVTSENARRLFTWKETA